MAKRAAHGAETPSDPAAVGIDPERLRRLPAAIARDVEAGQYDGAVIIVGRHGRIVLHEAIGQSDASSQRKARRDDIFAIMSLTKPMATALLLTRFERGELQLTSPVAEFIPEFGAKGKQRITIAQLLGHMGGIGGHLPVPANVLPDLAACVAAVSALAPVAVPGQVVSYSPFAAQSVLAEIVRRLDGGRRPYRQILHDEIFAPLGMRDTSLGRRPDLEPRRVPIVVRDRREARSRPELWESFNDLLREGAEVPAAGAFSTAYDCYRFAEMLRRGGQLDGARILSPLTVDLATANYTGNKPNMDSRAFARETRGWGEFPAYLGLGFYLRGAGIFPNYHGSLASPRTYGHAGAGSALFWVDPLRDMTFVGLTAGLMEETYSIERWQRLSDIALASIIAD
jgi:CubicO group peptidase (beta-lactamase class C family)